MLASPCTSGEPRHTFNAPRPSKLLHVGLQPLLVLSEACERHVIDTFVYLPTVMATQRERAGRRWGQGQRRRQWRQAAVGRVKSALRWTAHITIAA